MRDQSWRTYLVFPILLFLATSALFYRVGHFEFLAIDDAMHTEHNPYIVPFTGENLKRFWIEPYENAFTPLTYTLWMVQAHFAQLPPETSAKRKQFLFPLGTKFDPGVFHLGNLLTHAAAAIAAYFLLNTLFVNPFIAFLGALLFVVHPLQVEPVSWITGFRDVLAGFLGFLTLLFYFFHCKKSSPLLYGVATILFLTSTLAKSSSLSIIPMAIAIAIIVFKRHWKPVLSELCAWIILIIPLFHLFSSLNNSVALRVVHIASLPERFLLALDAIAFYLYKLVFPFRLTMDYGRTPQYVVQHGYHFATFVIPLAVAAVSGYYWWKKKNPWPFLAGLIFFAGLIPVLGIKPFIFQHISTVADRYVYFSLLGASVLACSILVKMGTSRLNVGIVSLYLGLLCALTWRQLPVWKNNEALFSQVIEINPRSWLALNDLGTFYEGKGEQRRAYELYRRAAELSDIASAWNNAGAMALGIKDYDVAVYCFSQALRGSGYSSWAYSNLSTAYAQAGRRANALENHQFAAEIDPTFSFLPTGSQKLAHLDKQTIVRKFNPGGRN